MKIRLCENKDVKNICAIYNYYIENTIISFEQSPLSIAEMENRIQSYSQQFPWLVYELGGQVIAYAYATQWQQRSAYKNTLETTIYVKQGEHGKGYGHALYSTLLHTLSGRCHALIAGIALPNDASIRLHETLGFEKVAHFKEVGQKFGRWIDVAYWQKLYQSP